MTRSKPVVAWAIVNLGKPVAVQFDKPGPRLNPDAVKVFKLVESNPRESAVVKAAIRLVEHLKRDAALVCQEDRELIAAVSGLRKGAKS